MSHETLSFKAWQTKLNSIEGKDSPMPEFLQCLAYKLGKTPEETAEFDMQAQHDSGLAANAHPDLSDMTTDDILNLQFADQN